MISFIFTFIARCSLRCHSLKRFQCKTDEIDILCMYENLLIQCGVWKKKDDRLCWITINKLCICIHRFGVAFFFPTHNLLCHINSKTFTLNWIVFVIETKISSIFFLCLSLSSFCSSMRNRNAFSSMQEARSENIIVAFVMASRCTFFFVYFC